MANLCLSATFAGSSNGCLAFAACSMNSSGVQGTPTCTSCCTPSCLSSPLFLRMRDPGAMMPERSWTGASVHPLFTA